MGDWAISAVKITIMILLTIFITNLPFITTHIYLPESTYIIIGLPITAFPALDKGNAI
ncbi:hypothetical protein Q5C_07900 [Leuconostoc pseudomesenteroides 4882]|nr:hypothetical protein Q5C_07900 [Leuconostoc pseudomesenteroides 4882]